jgi:hypothetical protein
MRRLPLGQSHPRSASARMSAMTAVPAVGELAAARPTERSMVECFAGYSAHHKRLETSSRCCTANYDVRYELMNNSGCLNMLTCTPERRIDRQLKSQHGIAATRTASFRTRIREHWNVYGMNKGSRVHFKTENSEDCIRCLMNTLADVRWLPTSASALRSVAKALALVPASSDTGSSRCDAAASKHSCRRTASHERHFWLATAPCASSSCACAMGASRFCFTPLLLDSAGC